MKTLSAICPPRALTAVVLCAFLAGCMRTPAEKEARFMKRGNDFVAKHDYPRAILEFRNAIQVMPKDAEPIYRLGLVYTQMGDYRTAFGLFRKAADVNPKHADAQLMIAKFQSGAHDPEVLKSARERVEGVLAAQPGNSDALRTLALLDMRLGKKDAAEQDLQTAVDKAPQDLSADVDLANLKLKQGDAAGAEAVLKNMVEKSPKSSDAVLTLAMFYTKRGRTAEAEPLVRRALELNPKSPAALALSAGYALRRGNFAEADQDYRTISQLPGQGYKTVHAEFLLQHGKADEAISELRQLLRQNPDDRSVRAMLVTTYAQSGHLQDAQKVLDEALKRNPKDSDALWQRSTFFLNSGQLSQTEADLHSVLTFNPQSAEAHYGLARVAALRGDALVQRQELNDALRLNPALLAARIDLSTMLRAKSASEAQQVLNDAPARQKQDLAYVIEQNWVWMALGKTAEVRSALDARLASSPTADLLYQDALLRSSQKDFEGARASLNKVLEQQPENMNAVDLLARTYAAQGNPAKAMQVITERAAARPQSPYLGSLVAVWEANAHHLDKSRDAFLKVIAANPDYLPARLAV